MFGDLTKRESRMNRDSADWFDDEFGKPETGIETFAAFIGFVFVIGLMVVVLW